jgi:hemerythrin
MGKKGLFSWEPRYSVGVVEIDNQHKKFIDTLARLSASISDRTESAVLDKAIRDLVKYATEHFGTEERYMLKFGFEGYAQHKMEHELFKDEVKSLLHELKASKDNSPYLAFRLIGFMVDWQQKHMVEVDQKYVECFKKNGLK